MADVTFHDLGEDPVTKAAVWSTTTEDGYWIGDSGPYLYDTTQDYDADPYAGYSGEGPTGDDETADAEKETALRTPGQVRIEGTPTALTNAIRLKDLQGAIVPVDVADIDDPSAELATLSADEQGEILYVRQVTTEGNPATIYMWDTAVAAGANPPGVVAGDGGYWVAIGGRTTNGDVVVPVNGKIYFDGFWMGVIYLAGGVKKFVIWSDAANDYVFGTT